MLSCRDGVPKWPHGLAMDLGAILLVLLTGLVVKVAVMILGARLVLRVYQATYQFPPKRLWLLLPKEDLPEIKLLWWSFVLFFSSELVCGIEAYILLQASALVGIAHGVISAIGMGLFALGSYLHLDRRILRYGTSQCLANRICRGCTITAAARCKFLLVILQIATFIVLAAIAAFFVPTDRMVVDTSKYLLPFDSLNAWFDNVIKPWLMVHFPNYQPTGVAYYLPGSVLFLEFRILPAITVAIALAGIAYLRRQREARGIRLIVLAAGILSYVYLGIVLNAGTGDLLIASLGHEIAEFWFLLIIAEFLRRSFNPEVQVIRGTDVTT
ncbi:MAG: hypothetical protein HY692_05735 [Cyanobacteria bacterium NC_groundwater_1444_Ag_S-0.65um_54_12]|nr:hypothetical protein [Cyanobacteria bacterium NC_groundwater_1444_Ag_S-0.65um_54_12]